MTHEAFVTEPHVLLAFATPFPQPPLPKAVQVGWRSDCPCLQGAPIGLIAVEFPSRARSMSKETGMSMAVFTRMTFDKHSWDIKHDKILKIGTEQSVCEITKAQAQLFRLRGHVLPE